MAFKCDNIIYDRHPFFEVNEAAPANITLHYCQDDTDVNIKLSRYLNGMRRDRPSDLLIRFSMHDIVANTIEGNALTDGKVSADARPDIEALKAELQAALALIEAVEYNDPVPSSTQTWNADLDTGDYQAIG